MPTQPFPFTEPEWKMPGYTGYIHGLSETFGHTPVPCQQETYKPPQESFLHTRTAVKPVTNSHRDPCNFPSTYKPNPQPVNLWPSLQTVGRQEAAKKAVSNIALGDGRINPFFTSYKSDFQAPLESGKRIRSPLRNKNLKDVVELKEIYNSAFQRVGEKRLNHMIVHMTERLAGKIGNANNNAFKLRKLFKMYDVHGTGFIEIEDFRVMTESFGMQLDDDSLLALFSRCDPGATGMLDYQLLMRQLLDSDYYALYLGAMDNTQGTRDAEELQAMFADLRCKFSARKDKLNQVFVSFDTDSRGFLDSKSFLAALAACNFLLSDRERECVLSVVDAAGSGRISYADVLDTFAQS